MNPFSRAYTPSSNRRLNELVGFLLFVAAILLLLALVSYSPADHSLNTAGPAPASRPAHNWAGILGAYGSDLMLQAAGIAAFLVPLMLAFLGGRWFRSRTVGSPGAKFAGALMLLVFAPGMLGLLPGHLHWRSAIPIEGLLGRIVGDALIHWFNLAGAYIVCAAVLAIGLYLSTTFSFATLETWSQTRFTFVFAGLERFKDWRIARAKARSLKELEKRRAQRVVVSVQETKAAPAAPAMPPKPLPASLPTAKTGIERMSEEQTLPQAATPEPVAAEPAFGTRADSATRPKTTMPKIRGTYKLPSSALLHRSDEQQGIDENELKRLAQVLAEKCAEFDAHGQVTQINPGPVVTTYEFKPEAGIKYSRITNLSDDLCLGLKAESILIERMAGKSTVGIQVPNRERETIWLREIIESQDFIGSKSKLTLSMGKDINGRTVTADLASMPHLLIAGSTGSGKSVAINAMIMSVLYKATPDEARLILVDPKRLELGVYEGVPHLFTPIITEPKLAANALRNAVREMERRLKALAEKGVRNIDQYNRLFDDDEPGLFDEQSDEPRRLPYIIIIIDELADLMMLDQGNVEESITRLAQMARAVGIHLILPRSGPRWT